MQRERGNDSGIETEVAPIAPDASAAPPLPVPARRRLAATVEAALAFVAVGVFVVWAVRDGGYAPEEWLPGGLLSLGLLCAPLSSPEVRTRLWERRMPLVLFGLYVVWSYASIAWAQVPGDAVDGANRTLVYWLIFALFSGLGLGRWGTRLVLCWGGAVCVVGTVSLVEAATAARPAGHFVLGRLAAPISYPDADAALFLSACLPLLVLASRRRASPASRAAAGAAAVVLVDLAVLCESRGSAVALPLALVLYLAAARSRLRAVAHVAVFAAAAAPALPALLAVEGAVVVGTGWSGAVQRAAVWIGVDALLGAIAFGLLALLDSRLRLGPATRVALGRGLLVAAAAGLLAAAGLTVAFADPVSRARTAWRDLTTNQEPVPGRTPHFASGLGTSRYDVWRIAVRQFSAQPLTGVGADNYLVGYLRQRRTHAASRYPSSLELRALSETGLPGAALFFGFLAVALRQVWRRARKARAPDLALACLAGSGYWLLHASIDWFWELPALTGAGLALLALGGAARRPNQEPQARSTRTRLWPRVRVAAVAAAAVAAAAVLALPWAAVSLTDEAVALPASPHAYGLLDTAASLNPFSAQPALAAATVAANSRQRQREWQALQAARRRSPLDWYVYFLLGIVAGQEHRPAVARAELAHAHRLSPQDLVVVYAQRRLAIGKPLSEHEVGAILLEISSKLRGVRQQ
ncbi:MAG: O-antigen ligase family protein [Gaiellaceae bacterium]